MRLPQANEPTLPTWTERLPDLGLMGAGLSRRILPTRHGPVSTLVGPGGTGAPLVLLHGMGSCGADLAPLIWRLRRCGGGILVPDLPGHGHSPAPKGGLDPERMAGQTAEALDGALHRPAVLFGSSLGGLAAVRFALSHPQKVAGLVLASPAGAPMDEDALALLLSRLRMEDPLVVRRFMGLCFARQPLPRPMLAWGLRQRFGRPEVSALLAGVRPHHMLKAEDLQRLHVPVTLLWGQGDRLFPGEPLAWFRRHLPPGSRILEIPGAGHAPYLERPGVVAESIRMALQ